ncbi:MAG: AAA family ATPase [Gammaproteobacteria bacterium]|nr:AAA family ATPase [Gammaproteobacteria bacterium]
MKEIYDWVDWFKELAQVVDEVGENGLIERIKSIDWGSVEDGTHFRLLNPEYGDENIDPLSFFYTLAMRNSTNLRSIVYKSVKEEFSLTTPLPPFELSDAWIFPTPQARANTLFHLEGRGDPVLMWKLFRDARKGFAHIRESDFNDALQVNGVKRNKLTQTLFLINPLEFAPYDDTMVPLVREIEPEPFDFRKYQQVLKKLRITFPGCDYCEINLFAYGRKDFLASSDQQIFQISSRVHGSNGGDFWHKEFSGNNWVRTGGPKSIKRIYNDLPKPKPGDVILVRSGMEGRGIGVVHKNDYKEDFLENWDDSAKIHVVWVNKATSNLEASGNTAIAFSYAYAIDSHFQNSPSYASTFQVIRDKSEGNNEDHEEEFLSYAGFEDLADKLFLPEKFIKRIVFSLERKRQIIFQGPPGTGKTYVAQELAKHLTDDGCWEIVQFHPSYSYEDFVRGYRPVLVNGQPTFELKDGPLLRLAKQASESDDSKKFILIIDEINRGNLARVLGELYFLLEYREKDIELMYHRDGDSRFQMPPNLYIIGTMNTSDRTIALVDLALRRRFAFVEFDPHQEPIRGLLSRWMQARTSGKVEWLVDLVASANDKLKNYGSAIGPSYFMREHIDDEIIDSVWSHEVFPYINEQFFGDPEKAAGFQLDALKESTKDGSDALEDSGKIENADLSNDTGNNEED